MKKSILLAAAAILSVGAANAQDAVERTNFGSNWSIGINGGVTTPMTHHAFFGSMRGTIGVNIGKQLTPVFGLGVEGVAGINTSTMFGGPRSSTAFDNSYVGAYGTVNLTNLFCGFSCEPRVFNLEALAGAGWGHDYYNEGAGEDWNYFATKVGLNFNFNVSEAVTLSLKPSIVWNMSDAGVKQTSAAYNINKATFNCAVGVTYNFGPGFNCVTVGVNPAEVAALNAQVNDLRGQLNAANNDLNAANSKANNLQAQLNDCLARPVKVVNKTDTQLNSVRYVFFRIGSSAITADQQPNVEMVAEYLKHHENAKVEIKGYASQDGNLEFNERLAAARAESVKKALVKKYGIDESRITAQGEGIGHMFKEESWNRVSICTIED